MRRWNTLSSVYDAEYQQTGQDLVVTDRKHEIIESQPGVFITEGVEMDKMEPPITPRGRSPSPGSRTCIPNDIIEQFQGDIYGRKKNVETNDKLTSKALSNVGTGIVPQGWRPPRSRTPILLAETPSRYPPRPLRQPPPESIPKSLQIVSIPKPKELLRCKSTPPRTSSPDPDTLPIALSDTSLFTHSTASMEVKGPSVVSESGAVPPPPSPEATVIVKNELQPTLETLCEEDERSSRNTSIADMMDKDVPLSRLSPLGGGSEMSEESVELPAELNENKEDRHVTREMNEKNTEQQECDKINEQQRLQETATEPTTQENTLRAFEESNTQRTHEDTSLQEDTKEQHEMLNDQKQTTEKQSIKHESTKVNDTEITTADEENVQIKNKASELDELEKFTGLLLVQDTEDDTTSSDLQGLHGRSRYGTGSSS